jgi:hypothetical protein
MLHSVHKVVGSGFAVESAINNLRHIISHRIQSHFNQNQFEFDKYITDNFNGNLIKEDIVKHLPQIPSFAVVGVPANNFNIQVQFCSNQEK